MDNNPLGFLEQSAPGAEDPRVDAQPAPEATPAPEPPQSAPERPRNADGTFAAAPVEPPPEAPLEPAPAKEQPPLTEKETVGFYKAMQEERDRRRAAERRAQAAEDRLKSQAPPSEPLPADQQHQMDLYRVRFDVSHEFATRHYGPELTEKIAKWAEERCGSDPHFNQQILNARLPFEAAKEAYDREQILAEVKTPDDLAAFRAWQAEKAAQGQAAPIPPQPPSAPPPRSLANAPGTGQRGTTPPVQTGEGAAYGSLGLG